MPHYANGTPAKVGDLAVCRPKTGQHSMGIIVSVTPGSTSCNAQLHAVARRWEGGHWYPVTAVYQDCVTLSECSPLYIGEPQPSPPDEGIPASGQETVTAKLS